MRCLSSNIWIKLPGLIEGGLESCSIYSQKQFTSAVGLGLDSQEISNVSWPLTSAFTSWSRALALTGLRCQGF